MPRRETEFQRVNAAPLIPPPGEGEGRERGIRGFRGNRGRSRRAEKARDERDESHGERFEIPLLFPASPLSPMPGNPLNYRAAFNRAVEEEQSEFRRKFLSPSPLVRGREAKGED